MACDHKFVDSNVCLKCGVSKASLQADLDNVRHAVDVEDLRDYDNERRLDRVLTEVKQERVRQEELKADGKFLWTCSDNYFTPPGAEPFARTKVSESEKLAVLSEEVGEASKEVVEGIIHVSKGESSVSDLTKLRKELVQVAAVAVAWVESLDKRFGP